MNFTLESAKQFLTQLVSFSPEIFKRKIDYNLKREIRLSIPCDGFFVLLRELSKIDPYSARIIRLALGKHVISPADSDRLVCALLAIDSNTFDRVFNAIDPDLIVFLFGLLEGRDKAKISTKIMGLAMSGLTQLEPVVSDLFKSINHIENSGTRRQLIEYIVLHSSSDEIAHKAMEWMISYKELSKDRNPSPIRSSKKTIGVVADKLSRKYVSYATSYRKWLDVLLRDSEFNFVIFTNDTNLDEAEIRHFESLSKLVRISKVNDAELINLIAGFGIQLILRFSTDRSIFHQAVLNLPIICFGNQLDLRGGATFTPLHESQYYGFQKKYMRAKKILLKKLWVHTLDRFDAIHVSTERSKDFISTNRSLKYSNEFYDGVSSLLKQHPERNIFFKFIQIGDFRIQENINREFYVRGVDSDSRLCFLERTDPKAHLAVYQENRQWIDTFPCSGGLTTFESLWMGQMSPLLDRKNRPNTTREIYEYFDLEPNVSNNLGEWVSSFDLIHEKRHLSIENIRSHESWTWLANHETYARMIIASVHLILGGEHGDISEEDLISNSSF